MRVTSTVREITRAEIEEFLYEEAALLDAWRLREWLTLLTDDATYEIPSTDTPDGESHLALHRGRQHRADPLAGEPAPGQSCLGRESSLEDPPADQQLANPGDGRGDRTRCRQFCRLSHACRAGRHVCREVRVHAGAR